MISSSATNTNVDILNTFKKNRKDFSREKTTITTKRHQCHKTDKSYNSLIIIMRIFLRQRVIMTKAVVIVVIRKNRTIQRKIEQFWRERRFVEVLTTFHIAHKLLLCSCKATDNQE